jgi:hypothetical protein
VDNRKSGAVRLILITSFPTHYTHFFKACLQVFLEDKDSFLGTSMPTLGELGLLLLIIGFGGVDYRKLLRV